MLHRLTQTRHRGAEHLIWAAKQFQSRWETDKEIEGAWVSIKWEKTQTIRELWLITKWGYDMTLEPAAERGQLFDSEESDDFIRRWIKYFLAEPRMASISRSSPFRKTFKPTSSNLQLKRFGKAQESIARGFVS